MQAGLDRGALSDRAGACTADPHGRSCVGEGGGLLRGTLRLKRDEERRREDVACAEVIDDFSLISASTSTKRGNFTPSSS